MARIFCVSSYFHKRQNLLIPRRFQEEFLTLVKKDPIEFDERYLWA
jgi:hypothetical protein